MPYKLIWSSLLMSFLLFSTGCSESTLAEKISGTWKSAGYTGKGKVYKGDFMQLKISKDGNINMLKVLKRNGKTKIQRKSGKVEGSYILFDDNEAGEIVFEGGSLIIIDIKRDKSIIFNRI